MKKVVTALVAAMLVFAIGCETDGPTRDGTQANHASSQAAEIEGAFGLKLGDVFDTSMGQEKKSMSPQLSYTFTPTNRVRNFEWHSVTLTQKDHRICTISAIATFKSRLEADVEIDVLMKVLQDKYGREWKPGTGPAEATMRATGMRAIRRGNRSIVAKVQSSSDSAQVVLRFRDEALEKVAEKEAIQKIDKSGL